MKAHHFFNGAIQHSHGTVYYCAQSMKCFIRHGQSSPAQYILVVSIGQIAICEGLTRFLCGGDSNLIFSG